MTKPGPKKVNPVAKNLLTGLNRAVTMRDRKNNYSRKLKRGKQDGRTID